MYKKATTARRPKGVKEILGSMMVTEVSSQGTLQEPLQTCRNILALTMCGLCRWDAKKMAAPISVEKGVHILRNDECSGPAITVLSSGLPAVTMDTKGMWSSLLEMTAKEIFLEVYVGNNNVCCPVSSCFSLIFLFIILVLLYLSVLMKVLYECCLLVIDIWPTLQTLEPHAETLNIPWSWNIIEITDSHY
jgi:hypothetical protein